MNGTERTKQILDVALELAEEHGYTHISREQIAKNAGVSATLVSAYFGTMPRLRSAVMQAAVRRENAILIAQGLVQRDDIARKAPIELKAAAANIIANM